MNKPDGEIWIPMTKEHERYLTGRSDLVYSFYAADDAAENRHPQVVMKELGINYEKAIPQPLGDQWTFEGCTRMPRNLPPYLKRTTA